MSASSEKHATQPGKRQKRCIQNNGMIAIRSGSACSLTFSLFIIIIIMKIHVEELLSTVEFALNQNNCAFLKSFSCQKKGQEIIIRRQSIAHVIWMYFPPPPPPLHRDQFGLAG